MNNQAPVTGTGTFTVGGPGASPGILTATSFDPTGGIAAALFEMVKNSNVVGWVETAGPGTRSFNGKNYDPITNNPVSSGMTVRTVPRTANFGGGPVDGSVTQFVVTPEPATWAMLAAGGLALGIRELRRRRSRTPASS